MWQFQTIYKYTVKQVLSPVLRNMIVRDKQLCPLGDDSLVWFRSVNVHIFRAFTVGGHTGLHSNLELKRKVYNLIALWGVCVICTHFFLLLVFAPIFSEQSLEY